MCTAMTVQAPRKGVCFGRTMDFSYPLAPELYRVPAGYVWDNRSNTHRIKNRYSFLGIGQDLSPILFADGVNEKGFAAAALYFPGYARYDSLDAPDDTRPPVAAIELTGFLLGLCADVGEAASLLRAIRIVGAEDPVTNSVAPLHWIVADQGGRCMTVEKMGDGLHLMDNPIGVLTNSPDFGWQMTNLRNYMEVSPVQCQKTSWGPIELTPFGQGAGTFGLPGDFTPPSRFVRAAFQKSHLDLPKDREGFITACFHLFGSVSIPKGIVMTGRGTADYTQYTAVIDLSAREYFFQTYENSRIACAKLLPGHGLDCRITSLGKLARTPEFDCWNMG